MFEIIPQTPLLCSSDQFSEQIGTAIQQRAHSQVRDLQIDLTERDITVSGRVGSYHALQLVIEAVKELQAEYRVPVRVQVRVFNRSGTV